MGCYYETCAVTGLPITSNDETVVFLLTRSICFNHKIVRRSGSDAFWEPIGFPLYGEYDDDHGWIKNLPQTPLTDWTLSWINRYLVTYEDYPITKGSITFDTLNDALRNNIHVSEWSKETHPVTPMFIRRDVFDGMIATYSSREYHSDCTEKGYHYEIETIKEIEEGLRARFDVEARRLKYRSSEEDIDRLLGNNYDLRVSDDWANPFRRALGIINGKNFHLDEFAPEFARLMCFAKMMDTYRLDWGPRQGAGSQECDWGAYRKHHAMVGAIIERAIAKRTTECGYDETLGDEYEE